MAHSGAPMSTPRRGIWDVRILPSVDRKRAHITGEYELATNIKHLLKIDADFFRGKSLLIVDDIYTTGRSSEAFISAIEAAGANVRLAMFLAKTRFFYKE